MAEIVLSQVGAAIGAQVLPGGLTLFGQTVSGAAIGQAIGGLAGRALDSGLAAPIDGPKIKSLHVMESREGAGLPLVYGRMRVAGQVIWAARFKQHSREQSTGKGGPKITDYSYSVSFAVALCRGPITRVDRIWANGELISLGDVNWRLYTGSETQLPDPLIEALEGADAAPAYRGTAYIVFEDLPLDAFGNRLPQMSFEVVRASNDMEDSLSAHVKGVNIIPASGEFVYASTIVRETRFPGIEQPLNMNNSTGRADFLEALDQLQFELPLVTHAALTVAWFGDDVRAGTCRIRPGVETRDRETLPYAWSVDGTGRADARLLSQTSGQPNFGGTPADEAVLEGIAALKAAGIGVTLSPFLMMDVPPGNGLPDPFGWGSEQAAFPWRGRIRVSADQTAAARIEIEAFVGEDGGFGFRHFILHHARLAVQAGGVDAFLIGSEMVSLTQARDETGAFPFVEALVEIAAEAKAILGPDVHVSYAADWTEYGAYSPPDGSGDVLFPLDPLWGSEQVDFVGIDWYPPGSDWRDGADHLDLVSGATSLEDRDYLRRNMAGGEDYDWYYASAADRDVQHRTPIEDTWLGEHWLYRKKDLRGWWESDHYQRVSGTRPAQPSAWRGGGKPVRLIELGYPAIDKGTNAPNLFYDPKSAESAMPPYSNGLRDDLLQRRALAVSHDYWAEEDMVEQVLVWAWDARPWPDFPARDSVWSDGDNWQFGHWLNGRTGLIDVRETVEDLAIVAGITLDASDIDGVLEGFAVEGVTSLASALAPLATAFDFTVLQSDGGLKAVHPGQVEAAVLRGSDAIEASYQQARVMLDKRPGVLALNYISGDFSYQPSVIEAGRGTVSGDVTLNVQLPLVLSDGRAKMLAEDLLARAQTRDRLSVAFAPGAVSAIDVLDRLQVDDQAWIVERVEEQGLRTGLSLRPPGLLLSRSQSVTPPSAGEVSTIAAQPLAILIDGPALHHLDGSGLFVAASGTPWVGSYSVSLGSDADALTARATVSASAGVGRLVADLPAGPYGEWDTASALDLEMSGEPLSSATEAAVLAGANRLLVEHADGWELIAWTQAELIAEDRYRLQGLLRGLAGSPIRDVSAGRTVILADSRLSPLEMGTQSAGQTLFWQFGEDEIATFTYLDRASLPYRVGQLSAALEGESLIVTWSAQSEDLDALWSAPTPASDLSFCIEAYLGETLVLDTVQAGTTLTLAADLADQVRIAAKGADDRMGEWASIPLPPV